ncbi:hypothetical protein Tco_0817024 [Tanacetum coccineum]
MAPVRERVDIQSKNVGYDENGNRNTRRTNKTQETNAGNGLNWFRRLRNMIKMFRGFQKPCQLQERPMFSVTTTMKKATMHMLVQDLDANRRSAFMNTRVMRNSETFIHTFIDDQMDSDIIFDDPYVEDNGGKDEYDSNAHDRPYADIESVIYNVQVEAENQRKMNNELKKQKGT